MRKFSFLSVFFVIAVFIPVLVAASTEEHLHERYAHYQGDKVENVEHAHQILNASADAIGKFLESGDELEVHELEEIHERTYSLENAVDFLNNSGGIDKSKIASLDEVVQAIHYASENQDEAVIREWFLKLNSSIEDLNNERAEDLSELNPVKQDSYLIVIKDHKFSPEEIVVPAGEKIKLIIDNQDPTPEEFESHDMNREKIIRGHKKATIYVGPLSPGRYHFFGEFNMDTANGYIVAK